MEDQTDWVQVPALPPGADEVRVRGRRDDSGRLRITDLYLHGQRLTAETLRGLSLARLEAGLNRPPEGAPREQLLRPDRTGPEEFYARVAAAYVEFAALSKAPAKMIAAEAGVPLTTAHRWVREARRRGFLPAGRKGRAG